MSVRDKDKTKNACVVFVYPELVGSGEIVNFVDILNKHGMKLIHSTTRLFEIEELKLIFYPRKDSQDFENFCKHFASSQSALLHFEGIDKLSKAVEALPLQYMNKFYTPSTVEENGFLLDLVEDNKTLRETTGQLAVEVSKAYANLAQERDETLSNKCIDFGRQIRIYYLSMMISGFDKDEAFILAQSFQDKLLDSVFEDEEDKNADPD